MFLIKHIPSWVWFEERKYLTKGEQRSICHKEIIKYGIKLGYSMAAFFSKVQLVQDVQDVHRPRVATLLKKRTFYTSITSCRTLPLQVRYHSALNLFSSFMTEAVIYRNQSIDWQSKSTDWFLYDNGLRHERVRWLEWKCKICSQSLRDTQFLQIMLTEGR